MYANGGETLADFQKMLGVNVTSPQNLSAVSMGAGTIPAYEPNYDERVLTAAKGAEARYAAAGLGTAAERAAELEEQKNLTQAQMLFDIAGTALAFAGPMQGETGRMSAAERLAMAAQQTKLLPTIGARAQQQLEAKKAAGKEERALKLAAVQRGETQVDAEIGREEARKLQELKNKTTAVKATKPFVTTKPVVIGDDSYPKGTLLNLRPAQVSKVDADALTPYKAETGEAGAKKSYTVTKPIKVDGMSLKKGDVINVSSVEANDIKGFKTSVIPYEAPKKQGDVNVLFPDNTQQVLSPGTKEYDNAIKPTAEGGKGGLLAGTAKVPDTDTVNLRMPNGDIKAFEKNSPEFKKAIKNNAVLSGVVAEKDRRLVNMIDPESGDRQSVVEFSEDYYSLAKQDYAIGSTVDDPKAATTKSVRTTESIIVNGTTIPAGTAVLLSDADIAAAQKDFGADVFEEVAEKDRNKAVSPFGSGSAGKALNYFVTTKVPGTDTLALDAYADGADDPILEAQFAAFTKVTTDATGRAQKNALPPFVVDKIKTRVLAGGKSPVPLNTLGLTRAERTRLLPSQDVPLINPDTNEVNIERALADGTFIIDIGADLTQATGFPSTVDRIANALMNQFGKIGLGPGYAGEEARLTTSADVQLKELARRTIATFRPDTRIFKLDVEGLESLVAGYRPGGFASDQGALASLKKTRDSLALNYKNAIEDLQMHDEVAGSLSPADYGIARTAERDLRQLIAEYTAAIVAFETNIRPGGAVSAVSTSSNTAPPVTSTLPRASQSPP